MARMSNVLVTKRALSAAADKGPAVPLAHPSPGYPRQVASPLSLAPFSRRFENTRSQFLKSNAIGHPSNALENPIARRWIPSGTHFSDDPFLHRRPHQPFLLRKPPSSGPMWPSGSLRCHNRFWWQLVLSDYLAFNDFPNGVFGHS